MVFKINQSVISVELTFKKSDSWRCLIVHVNSESVAVVEGKIRGRGQAGASGIGAMATLPLEPPLVVVVKS